jgi:hypothetical protein
VLITTTPVPIGVDCADANPAVRAAVANIATESTAMRAWNLDSGRIRRARLRARNLIDLLLYDYFEP